MLMPGTLLNTGTIIAGTLLGSLLRRGIPERQRQLLMDAVGLAACGVGVNAVVQNMPKSEYPVLFIVSLALGSLIGSRLDPDRFFRQTVSRFGTTRLGEGLSTAVLLYCIGTLSILGPVKSALEGDLTFLCTNAALDLFTSMILGASYGIGVIAAAGVLFLWQGAIYFGALALGDVLQGPLMTEISIVGGFLIACSGLTVLKIKEFKTVNLLPALLVPPVWFALKALWSGFVR